MQSKWSSGLSAKELFLCLRNSKGIQQGIQQGLLEGIAALLEIKFGERGLNLLPEVEKIDDPGRLRKIKDVIRISQGIQDVEKILYH